MNRQEWILLHRWEWSIAHWVEPDDYVTIETCTDQDVTVWGEWKKRPLKDNVCQVTVIYLWSKRGKKRLLRDTIYHQTRRKSYRGSLPMNPPLIHDQKMWLSRRWTHVVDDSQYNWHNRLSQVTLMALTHECISCTDSKCKCMIHGDNKSHIASPYNRRWVQRNCNSIQRKKQENCDCHLTHRHRVYCSPSDQSTVCGFDCSSIQRYDCTLDSSGYS